MTRINIMSLLGGICLSMILQITTVFAIECVGNNYEQVWPEIENTQIPSFKLDATYTDASERYANIKVSELVLDRQAIPSFRWCGYGLLFSDNINTLTETDNLQEVEVELKNQKAELIVRLGDGLGHLAIARITLTSDFDFNSITSTSPESITVSTTLNPTIVTPLAVINISGSAIYNTSESVTSGTVTISTSENSWTTSLDSSGKYNRDIDAPANSENINIEVSDGSLSGSVQSFLTVQNENDVPTQCEPANLKITEEAFDRNHPLRACLRFETDSEPPFTKVIWNFGDGETEESTDPLGKRICHDYSYHPLNDVFRGSVEATKTDGRCFSDTFLAHVYEVELNGEIHLVETNPINFLPYVVGSGQSLPSCKGGAISFMGGDSITIYAPILTGKDANRFKVFLDGQSNQSVILENSLDSIDLEICPLESTTLGNFEATVSIATTAVNQPLIEIPVSIRFISEDEADGDKPDLKLTQPTGNLGQIETSATSIVLVGTVQDASTIRELICETQNNRVEVEIDHTIKGKSIAWTTPAIPLVPGDNKLKCMATDEFSRSSSVHLTATRKTNLPNIRVEPVDGESSFHFVGYEDTGYFPRIKQYTLTNTSDRTINWSISGSHYLEIYPFFGRTLAPGAKTTIDIVVNPNVTRDFLTDGYHNIEIILKEQGTPATLKLEGTLNKFVDIQRQNYRFYPARGSEWKQAFYSLARAPDGGYLFGGTERGSSWECSIMRVNHEGIPIWQRYYGDTSYRDVNTILRVGIEEFVFTCENSVIKIDDQGNILWKLPFEAQDGNQFKIKSITKMEDSPDLIVAGEWFAVPDAGSEPSNKKLSVVRLASDGNVVWQKRLDPDNSVEVNHVTSTSDDGFFIVGTINTTYDTDLWVVKFDGNGNVQWEKSYGYLYDHDSGNQGYESRSGEYVIIGATRRSVRNQIHDIFFNTILYLSSSNGVMQSQRYVDSFTFDKVIEVNDDEDSIIVIARKGSNSYLLKIPYLASSRVDWIYYKYSDYFTDIKPIGGDSYLAVGSTFNQSIGVVARFNVASDSDPVFPLKHETDNKNMVSQSNRYLYTPTTFDNEAIAINSMASGPYLNQSASVNDYIHDLHDDMTLNNISIDFISSNLVGKAPLTVKFTDLSETGKTWKWDWGDGSESRYARYDNTIHTYHTPGKYKASLATIPERPLVKKEVEVIVNPNNDTPALAILNIPENVEAGSAYPITWQQTNSFASVEQIVIEAQSQTGESWELIDTLPGNTTSYNWFVPPTARAGMSLKVSAYGTEGGFFSVIIPLDLPDQPVSEDIDTDDNIGDDNAEGDGLSDEQVADDPDNGETPIVIDNLTQVGHLSLDNLTSEYRVVSVAVSGNYAYLVDDTQGLRVVDVVVPTNPILIGSYNGAWRKGSSPKVVVSGNYVYIGQDRLYVIDISDPSNPVEVGNCRIPDRATDMTIVGNYAYLTGGLIGLDIININDTAHPVSMRNHEIKIIDGRNSTILDPNNPLDGIMYPTGVAVSGKYAYLVGNAYLDDIDKKNQGLYTVDISNPTNLDILGNYNASFFGDIEVSGDYAYVVDYNTGLQVIDISNPAMPKWVGSYDTETKTGCYRGIVLGNYAYMACNADGLQVIDVSNPTNPVLATSFDTTYAWDVAISGDYAYIADGINGLVILKLNAPQSSIDGNGVDSNFPHFIDSGQELITIKGNAKDVALGDVDGDGDLDAFVANYGTFGSEWSEDGHPNKVWLNDGSGTFTDSGQSLGNSYSFGIALGDVDNDGDLDAFVANTVQQPNKVWLNNGTGIFTDSGQNLGNSYSFGVALSDVDNDGDIDAVIANALRRANKVWLNNGSGIFKDSGQNLGNSSSRKVALGDIDGDGDLDIAVANDGQPNKVWLNDGSGTFSDSGQNLGNSDSWGIALGDVDGDSDLDIIVANNDDPSKVWLNNGSGIFTDSGQELDNSTSTGGIAVGDIDGDSDLDSFIIDLQGSSEVWLNNGSGTFTDTEQNLGNSSGWGIALGDVDGDSDFDAFVVNYGANKVWLNQSKGIPEKTDEIAMTMNLDNNNGDFQITPIDTSITLSSSSTVKIDGRPVEVDWQADGIHFNLYEVLDLSLDTFEQPVEIDIRTANGEAIFTGYYPFVDVGPYLWYTKPVMLLWKAGILESNSDNRFGPFEATTREEFMTVLALAIEESMAADSMLRRGTHPEAFPQPSTKPYNDIEVDRWSAPYIQYAKERRLIQGCGDGNNFCPTVPMIRADAVRATVLTFDGETLTDIENGKLQPKPLFQDVKDAKAWYYPYVYTVQAKEWLHGYADNSFKPEQAITHAEGAKLISLAASGPMVNVDQGELEPTVADIFPKKAIINEATTFMVEAIHLPDSTVFWIRHCQDMEIIETGAEQWQFRCTPTILGTQRGNIKDKKGGTELYTFVVEVSPPDPVVASVSPETAIVNKSTVFTIVGSDLPDGIALFIEDCANLTALGGTHTQQQFSCTPTTTGNKRGIIQNQIGGVDVHNFTVNVETPPMTVTSVSPTTATLEQVTVFTVQGNHLTESTTLSIEGCNNLTALSGGTATQRRFSCTPRSTGSKSGTVKDRPAGTELYTFTVLVSLPPAKVESVSPSQVIVNEPTVFTVQGKNLPKTKTLWIDDCLNLTVLQSSPNPATQRYYWRAPIRYDFGDEYNWYNGSTPDILQFRCTPKQLGFKKWSVKENGKTLFSFAVTVLPQPTVSSVSPPTATLNQSTVFTVRGNHFTDNLVFSLSGCSNISALAGGTATQRRFRCTPTSNVAKQGTVKADGKTLFDFTVNVSPPPPTVSSVSPQTATLNQTTVFTVKGNYLTDDVVLAIDGCTNLTALSGGTATQRQFRCTASSVGTKQGTVKADGKTLFSFTVNVLPPPMTVTSVSPKTATLDQVTVFTVKGNHLTDGVVLAIDGCTNLTALSGGTATQRPFRCVPTTATGAKQGTVKADGKTLFSFTVNVLSPPLTVSSVSPLTATLNQSTVFTIKGTNLPNSTAFWIGECANLTALDGNSTQRQFRCTPSYTTGIKQGVVKDKSGGKELLNFTVKVSESAPVVSVSSVSPLTAKLNQSTVFTVIGNNLPDSTAFWIGECKDVTLLGDGTATQRQFRCTPSYSVGIKEGVIKDKSDSNVLFEFTVNVSSPVSGVGSPPPFKLPWWGRYY